MYKAMKRVLPYRRPLIVLGQVGLVVLANYLAFLLRFDGAIPAEYRVIFLRTVAWLVLVRGVAFVPFRLYEGLWRYAGIWDLQNIIGGALSSTLVFYALVRWGFALDTYPRSIFFIDSILLIFFLGGIRLARRLSRELGHVDRERTVLIFGAGDAGEMIVRDMKNNAFYDSEPVGFIDDDPSKVGRLIHGVRVLGTRHDLPTIMTSAKPDEVLVAITGAEPATIRNVVKALEPFKVPIKTLPNLRDIVDGKLGIGQIRDLAIDDLLARPSVDLDSEPVRRLITDKRVMVTGAGGSIGSELCRQIAALHPKTLVLYERHENALYAIDKDLRRAAVIHVRPILGDVTDAARVSATLAEESPQIIFHAAAHKHVPLMEMNPCEAVKNNVRGTRVMVEAAAEHDVERFVLISTDKAVNPTSVMGVTKRIAELLVQTMTNANETSFAVVRFGNVLGSNGSVVPLFLEQIKAGGPVTVTDPEMRRYFMLIPEAIHLVLHAAALSAGGDVYVLEMGDQIKIVDMARNLIRLAGFVPEQEIPIKFVGLRPGEKLFEELVGPDEMVAPAPINKMLRVRTLRLPDTAVLAKQIVDLEELAFRGAAVAVIEKLCEIVPTFRPWNPPLPAPITGQSDSSHGG